MMARAADPKVLDARVRWCAERLHWHTIKLACLVRPDPAYARFVERLGEGLIELTMGQSEHESGDMNHYRWQELGVLYVQLIRHDRHFTEAYDATQ